MKIHLIGTGDVFSSRLSPSFVLDGCILIETPNGISKMLINQNEKIENLSLCLISHLHGDHFWDMPFLLLNKNKTKGKKVTVVGPVGIKKNIFKCCQMAFSSLDWEQIFYNTIENIYELSENEQINHEQYKVFAISVEHGNEKCFGFKIINKDKKVFSYSGDCVFCQGVLQLALNSDICCVNVNDIERSSTHMGISDVIKLKRLSQKTEFYLVHTPDKITNYLQDNKNSLKFPVDDTIINLL